MKVFTDHDVSSITLRDAQRDDVAAIMYLYNAGGPDGNPRGTLPETLPQDYYHAFDKIKASKNDHLMVAEWEGRVIGTFHITYLYYLAAKGHPDMQIESVHVHPELRGHGIGGYMMRWAIAMAKEKECRRVQLTTHKLRLGAHRFYERLGFTASHQGMKLTFV